MTDSNPVGRPSKYDPIYIESATTYLEDNTDILTEGKLKVKLPTIEGFAAFVGVNKTTLYEWSKVHPEFSNALDKIKTEQQKRLVNSGLSGDYNSTIAKLVLSANHGMSEKTESKVEHSGGVSLTDLFNKAKEK